MSLTPSTMRPLGSPAPDFSLPDVETGRLTSLSNFAGFPALLVVFLCNHCPYVVHVREELARIAREYPVLAVVGITSNDVEEYPQDSPQKTRELARLLGFPVLYDETQAVAKAFGAACTPDFFLYDANLRLAYRGQLDSSRPNHGVADGRDLRAALDAVLGGRPADPNQLPSTGCNIKWKNHADA